ncbi:MAG: hypothetical protein ACYCS9_06590 [Candidatus Dormibacteria bacterium]
MSREEIDLNEAVDRLISAFDARGWREDGATAMAIARAASGARSVDPASLAAAVKRNFLVVNAIDRSAVEAVIGAVLAGTVVTRPPTTPACRRGDMTITVNNTGTMVATLGGGTVSGAQLHQQQVTSDEAIRSLVGEYAKDPEVRQIIDSNLPTAQKHHQLTAIVQGFGNWASDTVAKIVIGLLPHP